MSYGHPLYWGNVKRCDGCGTWFRREKYGKELICKRCRQELEDRGITNLSEAERSLFSQLLRRFDIEVVRISAAKEKSASGKRTS